MLSLRGNHLHEHRTTVFDVGSREELSTHVWPIPSSGHQSWAPKPAWVTAVAWKSSAGFFFPNAVINDVLYNILFFSFSRRLFSCVSKVVLFTCNVTATRENTSPSLLVTGQLCNMAAWLEMEGVETQGGREERSEKEERERERESCWFILYLSCFPLSSLLFRSHTDLHSQATNRGSMSTVTVHSGTIHTNTHTHTHTHRLYYCNTKPFSSALLLHHSSYTQCVHAHSRDNNAPFIRQYKHPCAHKHTPMHTCCIMHTHNCKQSMRTYACFTCLSAFYQKVV